MGYYQQSGFVQTKFAHEGMIEMQMRVILNVFVLVVLAVAQSSTLADEKTPTKLEGDWAVESVQFDGCDATGHAESPYGLKAMQISPEEVVLEFKSGRKHIIRYKIDDSGKPKTFDLLSEDGTKSDKIQGIYSVCEDSLLVAFENKLNLPRPKQFRATRGSTVAVYIFRRKD